MSYTPHTYGPAYLMAARRLTSHISPSASRLIHPFAHVAPTPISKHARRLRSPLKRVTRYSRRYVAAGGTVLLGRADEGLGFGKLPCGGVENRWLSPHLKTDSRRR